MKRKRAKPDRHSRQCLVCKSPQREQIEKDFVRWIAPTKICKRYSLKSRSTLYRHVEALDLTERRNSNVRGFLLAVLERGQSVKLTSASVLQAAMILTKLDADNRWVDISQRRVTHPLFERMSKKELLTLAEDGVFPSWVTEAEKKELLG